ncbi:hypothetical protein JX265_004579 [Neoarthrinium moseri]|uniref:Uncharacterized protein n=1 Tax=Neoarthrinium moseri TaxID=1658444 RepID=A0A9P9WPU6_9PEZI|nr:hypothetical protein JX266_000361 [Neoarthrinium moseri]KAI1874371.1 hypothetical protein JX265_004579 [Neoarthrinium moseri]
MVVQMRKPALRAPLGVWLVTQEGFSTRRFAREPSHPALHCTAPPAAQQTLGVARNGSMIGERRPGLPPPQDVQVAPISSAHPLVLGACSCSWWTPGELEMGKRASESFL